MYQKTVESNMTDKSNYKIKKKIGSGGMSTVYLAHDIRLDRDVAVKVLKIDPRLGLRETGKSEIVLRFQQEAKAAARLNHPNIVSIYHVGRQGEQYYIVMEYLDGFPLGQLMKPGERHPVETVLQWMDQVCDGLHFAHEHGVIHRDIKPDNLILLRNGTVKITDFGIARMEKSEMVKTKDDTFMGTIYYCSPEQLRQFKNIDRRTDVFSMGVVFYQLLTGTLPFREESIAETIEKIIHREPEPPRRIAAEIPASVERIVLKCLAKTPAARFQTAKEVQETLREARPSETARIGPEKTRSGLKIGEGRRMPLFFRLSMTVGLILMIAAFLFGYFIIESKKSILQKDAAIRGRHIAQMLSLLVNDPAIGSNQNLLGRYVAEIGVDARLVFIEMMKDNQVIVGYHADSVTAEEDVLMMSYPLRLDTPGGENLKIGFSKAAMNRQIRRIKEAVGLAFAGIISFVVVVLIVARVRSPRRERAT
jgi:serine/threonine protein kinase